MKGNSYAIFELQVESRLGWRHPTSNTQRVFRVAKVINFQPHEVHQREVEAAEFAVGIGA